MGFKSPPAGGFASLMMVSVIKYVLSDNPWLVDLEELHGNQWTKKLPEVDPDHYKGVKELMCNTYLDPKKREIVN